MSGGLAQLVPNLTAKEGPQLADSLSKRRASLPPDILSRIESLANLHLSHFSEHPPSIGVAKINSLLNGLQFLGRLLTQTPVETPPASPTEQWHHLIKNWHPSLPSTTSQPIQELNQIIQRTRLDLLASYHVLVEQGHSLLEKTPQMLTWVEALESAYHLEMLTDTSATQDFHFFIFFLFLNEPDLPKPILAILAQYSLAYFALSPGETKPALVNPDDRRIPRKSIQDGANPPKRKTRWLKPMARDMNQINDWAANWLVFSTAIEIILSSNEYIRVIETRIRNLVIFFSYIGAYLRSFTEEFSWIREECLRPQSCPESQATIELAQSFLNDPATWTDFKIASQTENAFLSHFKGCLTTYRQLETTTTELSSLLQETKERLLSEPIQTVLSSLETAYQKLNSTHPNPIIEQVIGYTKALSQHTQNLDRFVKEFESQIQPLIDHPIQLDLQLA